MLNSQVQYIVDEQNRRTSVLLPVTVYNQLLEDLHDLAVVAQRQEESSVNLEEMLSRLGLHDELQYSVSA